MSRGTFVMRNGQLIEKYGPKDIRPPVTRSNLACPMLISDSMDAAEHPADGKLYSSKSRFREVTKANGLIEVGNDPQRFKVHKKPRLDDAGLDRAIDRAIARAS